MQKKTEEGYISLKKKAGFKTDDEANDYNNIPQEEEKEDKKEENNDSANKEEQKKED